MRWGTSRPRPDLYDVALTVAACLRAGTRVDVAWAVETEGFSSRDRSDALAITPGGGRVGSLLSGALDDQLADVAALGTGGRLVDLRVSDVEAAAVGLGCGGEARCLVVPAAELPADLWDVLLAREPVCLVTAVDGTDVVGTQLLTRDTVAGAGEEVAGLFERGTSDAVVAADRVVTVLWPVPKLVVVGAGAVADALGRAASLLGWQVQVATDAAAAEGMAAGLAVLDSVVVAAHDLDLAGPALAAALESDAGYVGAVGGRRTQQARADWLADRGITDLSRIHAPAGLDIGATTPPEIAVSVLAEALAERSAR